MCDLVLQAQSLGLHGGDGLPADAAISTHSFRHLPLSEEREWEGEWEGEKDRKGERGERGGETN